MSNHEKIEPVPPYASTGTEEANKPMEVARIRSHPRIFHWNFPFGNRFFRFLFWLTVGFKYPCKYCGKLIPLNSTVCPLCGKANPLGY